MIEDTFWPNRPTRKRLFNCPHFWKTLSPTLMILPGPTFGATVNLSFPQMFRGGRVKVHREWQLFLHLMYLQIYLLFLMLIYLMIWQKMKDCLNFLTFLMCIIYKALKLCHFYPGPCDCSYHWGYWSQVLCVLRDVMFCCVTLIF